MNGRPNAAALRWPSGHAAIVERFGDPSPFLQRGEMAAWENSILVSVKLPAGLRLPVAGMPGVFRSSLRVHRLVADSAVTVFQAMVDAGLTPAELEFGGDYAFRAKRTASRLSTHSWGIAIDLNPGRFPLERKVDEDREQDPRIVKAFEAEGWNYGGGSFPGDTFTRDPMHFQAAWSY